MLNWAFIAEKAPAYVKAAGLTLKLAGAGIALSLVLGLLCALALYYRVPVLRRAVAAYIELSRNTPLLIQLFFLYFGLPKLGVMLSSWTCALIGLTFLGGSYMAEAFRGGLDSVSKAQIEAGLSIGMRSLALARHVALPQAFLVALPGLCANSVFLIKETSIVSIVALPDLMFVARELIGLYYNTVEALGMLVFAYVVILLPVSWAFRSLERRFRYAQLGT
ncbi:MAG: amino acid ABC transporter permease [Clostridiales Family XIII bacterium]|jgi:polar amino acid transport system permease protein|nr:amino acid ABC transporter permease [Clostridiales Family XIII bacterium]